MADDQPGRAPDPHPATAGGRDAAEVARLRLENAELTQRLRETQETIDAIYGGDVDALVLNGDIYTLESASGAANRLRQDVLSQMQDAVFAFDTDDHIIFVNAAAERRYGVKASEVMGCVREQVFTESPAPDLGTMGPGEEEFRDVAAARLSTHWLAGRRAIYVETVDSLLRGAQGEVIGSLAVIRDVTERIRGAALLNESEQRLRQINETLESTVLTRTRELMAAEEALRQAQKMEAVGQLTGGIAHDFNNLLAGMSTSLQVMQGHLETGRLDGLERYLGMAQESIRRAAALTQRLLAFARRQTLDPKPVDVNQLVAGVIGLIGRTVGPTIDIQVHGGPGLWTTKLDGAQLENALLNLCINARDAMLPDGGRLLVRSANTVVDAGLAAQFDVAPGDYVSLSVEDTGSGMPPEVIARVFDPFFTTKPVGQGTGLGLSMVYGFARQSGGLVRVRSAVGRGTTMTLFFPRYLGAAPDAASTDPAQSAFGGLGEGQGQTVLVVEDEEIIRVLIAEVLGESGFRTLTAENGPAAVRLLQSGQHVDLLVSDVGLPGGMNGRQVADAARVIDPTLKVLFVTGYAENAAIRDGQLEAGMEVLTKPFELHVLVAKVREMTAPTVG